MDASELSAIGDTHMRIVTPDMSPKQLVKAAQKAHPKASKKDIARAASFRSSPMRIRTSARPRTCRHLPSRSVPSRRIEQSSGVARPHQAARSRDEFEGRLEIETVDICEPIRLRALRDRLAGRGTSRAMARGGMPWRRR